MWIYIAWIPLAIDGFGPKFEFKEREKKEVDDFEIRNTLEQGELHEN